MKAALFGILACGALALTLMAATAQPPDDYGPRKKGPPPPPKGKWEPGKVIPPFVRDELDLSEAQQSQIRELEKDVKERLLKIFTPEQKERLEHLRQRGPGGPPPDGEEKRGPREEKKGRRPGGDRPRPEPDQVRAAPAAFDAGALSR